METPPLHAMVLPLPAQGHINPMLHLSALLSSRGCIVTFVNTHRSQNSILKSHFAADLPNIHFVSIPDGLEPPDTKFSPDTSMDTLFVMLDGLEKQQGHIEQLILRSRSSDAATVPITCLISDSFFPWTQAVAKRLGIAGVMFWASNVATLYVSTLCTTETTSCEDTEAHLPLEKDEMISRIGDMPPKRVEFLTKRFQGLDDSACVLVNTLQELETSFLRAVKLNARMRCVGPILPLDSEHQNNVLKPSINRSTKGSVQLEEEEKCLQWLDKQSASSVLYIAFGSVVSFPQSQIEQLALGIEASKQPFLWAARFDPAAGATLFPEGFVDRTKEQGLIISWAPQLRVLEHPAISCFLTHCGWNSTLESIFMGVPMLCLPRFADQPLNEKLVVKAWKLGMSFERGEDGEASWEEVSRAVMALMHSEEGKKVREEAKRWREVARHAVQEGGTSHTELTRFVEDMVGLREGKSSRVD